MKVPKNVKLNGTHFCITKIPNKRELKQISYNHTSDIEHKDFMNLYKKCIEKSYSFLVIGSGLASDNLLGFRKDLLERI